MTDFFETNDPKLRELISSIDAGIDPEHVLLIREVNWQRAMAAFVAFAVSAAIVIFAMPIFQKGKMVVFTIMFGAAAAIIVILGIWLLQLYLNGNMFYVAMDNKRLILRRGPNCCILIPFEEMVSFRIEKEVLSVTQAPNEFRETIIKGDYSKESLRSVLDRLKSWRNSPQSMRQHAMINLNTQEYLRRKKIAIRLISSGFFSMSTVVFLVFIDFNRINFLVAILIPLKVIFLFMSVCTFLAGILLFFTARKKKPRPERNEFEIDE